MKKRTRKKIFRKWLLNTGGYHASRKRQHFEWEQWRKLARKRGMRWPNRYRNKTISDRLTSKALALIKERYATGKSN